MVGEIREVHVLGETVSDIDTETVGAAVKPETQDRTELLANLGVGPVEVRLTRVEQVEVPLAVIDLCPGRTTEDRFPVVRRTDRAVVGDEPSVKWKEPAQANRERPSAALNQT